MLEFLLWFPYPVRVVVIFGGLFSVVPIVGYLNTGSWHHAWRFTVVWLRVIGYMVAAAIVVSAILKVMLP